MFPLYLSLEEGEYFNDHQGRKLLEMDRNYFHIWVQQNLVLECSS